MSSRFLNIIVLALITGAAVGCSSHGPGVQEAVGFLPGVADGFLIVFKFLGGYLRDPSYLSNLQAGTAYYAGFISGALAFVTAGTLLSLP
jgi:hypothetical protein